MRTLGCLLAAVCLTAGTQRECRAGDELLELRGRSYAVRFSRANGAIVGFSAAGQAEPIWRSGEHGLWRACFQNQEPLAAAQFAAGTAERGFRSQLDAAGRRLRMEYSSPQLDLVVTATAGEERLDLQAEARPKQAALMELSLPALTRFEPRQLVRLVAPSNGNNGVGVALHGSFFARQSDEYPSGWSHQSAGPKAYRMLYGNSLVYQPEGEAPVALRATPHTADWLGAKLAARVPKLQSTVNRPPRPEQADLVVVDSERGPYFSANHLGGRGYLWRVGAGVHGDEARAAVDIVGATIARLAAQAPAGRNKIGLLAVMHGPPTGAWSEVRVSQWRERLAAAAAASSGKVQFVELASLKTIRAATAADDYLALLNPYGEALPTGGDEPIEPVVAGIGQYVRAGGNWFEVGGHPFHSRLTPTRFYKQECTYPPAFADFFHWESRGGSAAMYRVQPRTWAPWQGARDPQAIFTPGRIAYGGDEQGGWCERPFSVFVAPGTTWRSPLVRLTAGRSAADALRDYTQANAITRTLAEKMPAEPLARFKHAVLVYYSGTCREKLDYLDRLPKPSLVHFADYLQGGFDKEYPDHLPPRPSFGSPAEFAEFFAQAHKLGHLVMPYTNPTWWCDHPKGPTFEKYGEAPLLRLLDGKLSYERYSKNDGFTVCHWHPAVQEANRRTVEQFSREYPCDVLFQDQCGARGWRYDANRASPAMGAYTEGLLSMNAEDCARKPLSTESGWDGVVNFQVQLCGMTWGIVPTEGGPVWRRLMKEECDPAAWEIFPVAQYIAHDKTAMVHHDLGQFVTNRQTLAWTLGLGYGLSARIHAAHLDRARPREWLRWLARLQASVCARYIGVPLSDFAHQRGTDPRADDGLLRAHYGPLEVSVNLDAQPRTVDGRRLAGYGFAVTGPGLAAANLQSVDATDFGPEGAAFVAEGDAQAVDAWIYARPGAEAVVLTPDALTPPVAATLEGKAVGAARGQGRTWRIALPSAADGVTRLWRARLTSGRK